MMKVGEYCALLADALRTNTHVIHLTLCKVRADPTGNRPRCTERREKKRVLTGWPDGR